MVEALLVVSGALRSVTTLETPRVPRGCGARLCVAFRRGRALERFRQRDGRKCHWMCYVRGSSEWDCTRNEWRAAGWGCERHCPTGQSHTPHGMGRALPAHCARMDQAGHLMTERRSRHCTRLRACVLCCARACVCKRLPRRWLGKWFGCPIGLSRPIEEFESFYEAYVAAAPPAK
jgi:hypothetical protein